MAYRCGYEGGYGLDTCVFSSTLCGGGYAGSQYAAGTYGGVVPCIGVTDSVTAIGSTVENFCIIDHKCIV